MQGVYNSMLPEFFTFSLKTKMIYGVGVASRLAEDLERMGEPFGKRRALLVTDEVIVKTGLAKKLKDGLKGGQVEIAATFKNIPPDSDIEVVQKCARAGKAKKCDMIIALGGGSVIDTAKVANVLMVKGGKVEDHMGAQLVAEPLLPCIIVPTTAGTGSEATAMAVIADRRNDEKLPFLEDRFLPELAVLDPEMTATMPPGLTAATGMDALTHAVEAYAAQEKSPVTDGLALHAAKMIAANLPRAVAEPEDLEARGAMLVGSFIAGVAFSHARVGIVHAVAHALGGVYHVPHGVANALILPYGMEYNLEAETGRYADLAEAMGVPRLRPVSTASRLLGVNKSDKAAGFVDTYFGAIDSWTDMQSARAGVERIRILQRQLAGLCGLPLNLVQAGVQDGLARMDLVVDKALSDGSCLYNPREVEEAGVREILKKALHCRARPIKVSKAELRAAARVAMGRKEIKGAFKDSDMLYEVLGGFFDFLGQHADIAGGLENAKICVRFNYRNPDASITIDTRSGKIEIERGESEKKPEVEMTMEADFAHYFWHGKANLVTALTRRQVLAKGNVPKTMKLLPILSPAYEEYPKFLKEKGLGKIVVTD